MRRKGRFFSLTALLPAVLVGLLVLPLTADAANTPREQPLVADLSKHLVAITTGFSGTDVLLFGATDGPGDIILVVRGPVTQQIVRRKGKVGGLMWVNQDYVTVENAPSFYSVASTRPLEDLVGPATLDRHQIGMTHLDLELSDLTLGETEEEFRSALFRLKEEQGLYSYAPGTVTQLANRLFRSELHFPSNVPTGTYLVEVYLVRDNDVVNAEITPLIIGKAGFGADLYLFAHEHSAWYGVGAILLAVVAGWAAGALFRRS
ncbi:TIGR02186 family protein [Novispirillum itersonii]|uniref:TIGR02186 family protein n=1 Tax=Novispirillum itersonii TaxID=189 RepID=UPI00035F6D26|nr:TIGR02186 family protein [Novispirillum itersonii]